MEYPFKDLLPLDEVLEREGYYKDWTHLDPEVFYSLTQISNFIKTKGYGVDVRLLIAQLAEHFGLKTTQVVDLANLLQYKFDNLEGVTSDFTNYINGLVAQMQAEKDAVIANATVDSEVILARGGKPTLQARLDETAAQLADNAISPEKFDGTDFEKLQQALDYGLENNVAVKFARMYDITGNTLMINRPELYYASDRKQLYLLGVGGGIKKTDAGFVFNATYDNTGDVNVSNMKFESVRSVGTKVWNGDKIIRIKSQNNQYRNVDTILSAPNVHTQTTYFSNEHITGGSGWKFEAKRFLDVVIDKCLVEDCHHFIRNTDALNISMCNSLRITSNLIENLTGTVARLAGSYGLAIHNNYIEFCEEYIDLVSLATNYPHFGLSIIGNTFYMRDDQHQNSIPAIKIKNVNTSTHYGNGGAFSASNVCAAGVLYDLAKLGATEFISGIGDFGIIINPSRFIIAGKPHLEPTSDGFAKLTHGMKSVYYKRIYGLSCAPEVDTNHVIELAFDISEFATVNVMQPATEFIIKNVVTDYETNRIIITITNTTGSILNANPFIVIEETIIV